MPTIDPLPVTISPRVAQLVRDFIAASTSNETPMEWLDREIRVLLRRTARMQLENDNSTTQRAQREADEAAIDSEVT